jgi:ABC-type branched-subunit amino acid transport system substrate-binding protein
MTKPTQWAGDRRKFLKTTGAGAVALSMAGCIGGGGGSSDSIDFGFYAPLSGPSSSVGQQMERGAELAKTRINENGGINGQEINLHFADTESEPSAGRNAVSSLIESENIDVLTGGFHTAVSVSILELAATEEVPLMISNSVGGSINDEVVSNGYNHSFKMAPPHAAYGTGWAAFLGSLQEQGVGYFPFDNASIALIGENTGYGNPIVDSVASNLDESDTDWTITSQNSVAYDETDFTSLLTTIESEDPDIVLSAQSNPTAAGNLISDFGDVGFEETHLMETWTPSNPATIETGGQTSNGVLWLTNIGVIPSQSEELRSAWDSEYDSTFPGTNSSLPWDNLLMVAEALSETGTGEDLTIDAWESAVLDLSYEGTAGTFEFQEENHQSVWGPTSGILPLGHQVRNMSNHLVWPDEYAESDIDSSLYE